MKEYKIIKGIWENLDHDTAIVFVEEFENNVSIDKFTYGIDFAKAEEESEKTLWPLHKILCDQIKAGRVELQDDIYTLQLAGLAPLAHGTVIKDGKIIGKERYRQIYKNKIRNRINELYSGYNLVKAEKNPTFKKNWKRKIDNLLKSEDRDDYLDVDLSEVEDE